ncbi:MAG: AAA family ATPase, partial [Chloroflexi bacterium]|nr:AAA family ATPase [Chloroflexota bacterium]
MLVELSVDNFGIIRHIRWRPALELNILTGETGAGKSLIVDALETLLGGRVGDEVIRTGANDARIEGVFRLDDSSRVKAVLRDRGLNDEEFVVLSREIE